MPSEERTIEQRVRDIEESSFRNEQGLKIVELMHENKKLKDSIGRANRKAQSGAPSIKGLATLGSKPTLPS